MVLPPSPLPSKTLPTSEAKTTIAVNPPLDVNDPVASTTPKQTRPYNWGKFQGWVSLGVGVFAAVFAIVSLTSGSPMDERATEYAIASPLLIISGYAFVRRKKFAVAMTYVWMIFYVAIFLFMLLGALTNKSFTPEQKEDGIGTGIGLLVPALLFWGLCTAYYRKRFPEFK